MLVFKRFIRWCLLRRGKTKKISINIVLALNFSFFFPNHLHVQKGIDFEVVKTFFSSLGGCGLFDEKGSVPNRESGFIMSMAGFSVSDKADSQPKRVVALKLLIWV